MTHVITSLCLRDNGCSTVCPVECISAGEPAQGWSTYYVDPATCIDCGACVPECPYSAIFPQDEVPAAYRAQGGEWLNQPGLDGGYQGMDHYGQPVTLPSARQLAPGEVLDLRESIRRNQAFYQ
jgi:ferredoxin